MRNRLFAALFLMFLPGLAAAAAPPANADYRLGVGDELRIKIFEWRSATGDVHEWTALDGNYDIGPGGLVSLPLIGELKASGATTNQLADTISSQLQSKLGLTIRPQASIEILQYRPFYILGDVNKPGEYAYRPGLTVLEAISIAGGRYRIDNPALVLNAAGDLRVLRLQYNEFLAQRARLQAELGGANSMTVPPELQSQQGDPEVARLIQREQTMFVAHRDALTSEVNALNQLKTLLNGEVSSLQDKMKNVDQELSLRKQELNNTTTLVQRGLAIAPRAYEQRESEMETEGRRLDLDTAALRAKEDIGKADQSIVELRNKTQSQVQSELAEVEQKIPETAARIATAETIVGHEGGTSAETVASAGNAAGEDPPAICIIVRTSDGQKKQINGDEASEIEPGDTIKVLRATGENPPANQAESQAAAPVRVAAEPPPPKPTDPKRASAQPEYHPRLVRGMTR